MGGWFEWYDLATNDAEKAKPFYMGLFGWTIKTMGAEFGNYDMWHNDGSEFSGIMPIGPEQQGVPPHWLSYLHAPGTIEDLVTKAGELGGTVMQPVFDIPTVGKMAILADPQGAVVAPFESIPRRGARSIGMGKPGAVAWNELMTTDPAAAAAFYSAIGGFSSRVADMGTGPYTLLDNEQGPNAGIMKMPDDVPHPSWLTYFEITQDSMDEALAAVTRLGGQVGMGPMEIPTVGTIAVVGDPTGAWFGLMKSAPMAS